jgi:site-specific DNA-adenine methylase
MSLFRYSGSKTRLLRHLPSLQGSSTLIEPFAGSAAFAAHYRPTTLLLAEKNEGVRTLWEWLRSEATADDLFDLEKIEFTDKQDVRTLNLTLGPETLLRLTTSGVMVGQLSSYCLNKQHKVSFDKLREALPWIKMVVAPVAKDFRDLKGEKGFHFVDPPYLKTSGNYIDKKAPKGDCNSIDMEAVVDYCRAAPMGILTYGHDAREVIPTGEWTLAKVVKVPRIRCGGTKDRNEHYCPLPLP